MFRILFVCHGNICRSPMAEFVMKDIVEKNGVAGKFFIESAATSSEELDNPVYSGTRRKLAEHGIECKGKRARQLKSSDYQNYDLIVGMDNANMFNMNRIFNGDPDSKIHLLLSFTANSGEVADPWYTDDFDATWQDVLAGCQGIFEQYK